MSQMSAVMSGVISPTNLNLNPYASSPGSTPGRTTSTARTTPIPRWQSTFMSGVLDDGNLDYGAMITSLGMSSTNPSDVDPTTHIIGADGEFGNFILKFFSI